MDAEIWIKIALDDLSAAQALYDAKHYRVSYFLFQQASEKANKAFALLSGRLTPGQLNDIKHDQLKIYRKNIVQQEDEIKQLINAFEPFPHTQNHEIINTSALQKYEKSLKQGKSFIDGIRARDMVNISAPELNYLYKQLVNLQKQEIKLPKGIKLKFEKVFLKIADWIGQFQTPEALNAKGGLLKLLEDKEQSKTIYDAVIGMMQITVDLAFIQYTLYACALLTVQHSSLTRYPDAGKNPLLIYTPKLPLVRKQPAFIELLENAIAKMQHFLPPVHQTNELI